MGDLRQETQNTQLDEIGDEPLEGSGFEQEIPDPSFETTDRPAANRQRHRSERCSFSTASAMPSKYRFASLTKSSGDGE